MLGMSEVLYLEPCLESQKLSFDSHFLSPHLFFCLVLLFFLLVIFLLMVHSPGFFPENSQTFFIKRLFFVWLLLSS